MKATYSDDPTRIDADAAYALLHDTYWARSRSREAVQLSIDNSSLFCTLHRTEILQIVDQCRLNVRGLEAIDGTPVIDIKPVLDRCNDA